VRICWCTLIKMGRFFKYPLVLMTFFISVSPFPVREKLVKSESVIAQPVYIRCATEGPSFWCSSVYLAQQCNTVRYCEHNVWRILKEAKTEKPEIYSKNYTKTETQVCTQCKDVMLDVLLSKDFSQHQVKKLFYEKLCSFIPQLEGVCHKVTNKFFDDLYQHIFVNSSPDQICNKLQFCPDSKESYEIFGKSLNNGKQSRFCTECIYAFYEFDMELANNYTRQEIKKSLLFLCASTTQLIPMGPFICNSLVNKFFDKLYQHMFIDSTPNEMCNELGVCPAKDLLPQAPINRLQVSRMCLECQFAMYQFEGFFNNKYLQQQIKTGLSVACAYQAPLLSVACKFVINEYYDRFYEHAFIMTTPQQICHEMGMCPREK